MAHEIHFTQVLLSSRTSSARHVIPVFWFGHLTTRVNPQTICLRQNCRTAQATRTPRMFRYLGALNGGKSTLERAHDRRCRSKSQPYSEILTELYEKYPDSRSAPGNQYRRTLSGSVRKVAKRSRIVMLRHSLAPEK